MRAICLIDTSVLCNFLGVPGLDQDAEQVAEEFRTWVELDTFFFLPLATILETGNHIGQISNGSHRRDAALALQRTVLRALNGETPWIVVRPWEREDIKRYLEAFPDYAMQQSGLGDLSIIKDFEHHCDLNQARHVFIWSLDKHLQAYDRPPRVGG